MHIFSHIINSICFSLIFSHKNQYKLHYITRKKINIVKTYPKTPISLTKYAFIDKSAKRLEQLDKILEIFSRGLISHHKKFGFVTQNKT